MSKTILIGDREAIPLRLIPYVTYWDFAPDAIARILALRQEYGFEAIPLTAYHLAADGTFKSIPPKHWDSVVNSLGGLTNKLKAKEKGKDANFDAWRSLSVEKLPEATFVWRDEFEAAYLRAMTEHKLAPPERLGDKELDFSPDISSELTHIALAGFPCKVESFSSVPAQEERDAESIPKEFKSGETESALPTDEAIQDDPTHWIDRDQLMARFAVDSDSDKNFKFWDKKIGRPPKWLETARTSSGKPGTSSLWNPITLAHCLLDHKAMNLKQLDSVIHTYFPELKEQWRSETEDMR